MLIFTTITTIVSGIMVIVTFLAYFIKPLREKILKTKEHESRTDEGIKCLLRSQMLSIYYHSYEAKTIRQHERENFDMLYSAYEALGGNSFIHDIYDEVREWKITT